MNRRVSYDFVLIIATVAVLFLLSALSIYAMFAFKLAQIQAMAPAIKLAHMERMNRIAAPLVTALILLLAVCVPKRLLPTAWLNRFSGLLLLAAVAAGLLAGVKTALLVVLAASLLLQLAVLCLALVGSERLRFEKAGYWVRLGSTLMHLGLILFVFDLFFFHRPGLHLLLFWTTTAATTMGMLFCFYAPGVAGLVGRRR